MLLGLLIEHLPCERDLVRGRFRSSLTAVHILSSALSEAFQDHILTTTNFHNTTSFFDTVPLYHVIESYLTFPVP